MINPIAGMGGRVGLKGSDAVVELAIERGAVPSAGRRAGEMLAHLSRLLEARATGPEIVWLTCAGEMGDAALRAAGFERVEVVYEPGSSPAAEDTRLAVAAFLEAEAELVVFCGGDGTARDVWSSAGDRLAMLGIPAGVKMYSAVFGLSPARTAEILIGYLDGRCSLEDAEILDVDEVAFREGRLEASLFGKARTPHEPQLVQAAKQVIPDRDEGHAKAQIAEHVGGDMEAHPETLYLLGPGSTVESIANRNGLPKTLLGVDAVCAGQVVGRDLSEAEILSCLDAHGDVRLVVSPIGAQGFVLGRGNQQLSPAVLRRIGRDRLVVVATPAKLHRTPRLHFDTGDADLDTELVAEGFVPVVTGYHTRRMAPAGA